MNIIFKFFFTLPVSVVFVSHTAALQTKHGYNLYLSTTALISRMHPVFRFPLNFMSRSFLNFGM